MECFFYIWNEKQLSTEKEKKKIRVIPPVESHFTSMGMTSEVCNEVFGIVDHFNLSEIDKMEKINSDVGQENSTADMAARVNCLNVDHSSDSSSDENECPNEEDSFIHPQFSFSESHRARVLSSSKSMKELCTYIQSVGQFENSGHTWYCLRRVH